MMLWVCFQVFFVRGGVLLRLVELVVVVHMMMSVVFEAIWDLDEAVFMVVIGADVFFLLNG